MSLPNRRLSLEYICNHCSFEMNQENHLHPTQFSFNSCDEKGKPASGGRGSARHMASRSRISQPTAAHLRGGTLEVVALTRPRSARCRFGQDTCHGPVFHIHSPRRAIGQVGLHGSSRLVPKTKNFRCHIETLIRYRENFSNTN